MRSIVKMKFGDSVRQGRKRRGMTQAELATAVGMSTPSISLIENGEHQPRQSTVKKLSDYLELHDGNEADRGDSPSAYRDGLVVAEDDLLFPISVPVGSLNFTLDRSSKDDALRLIFWALKTGIVSVSELNEVIQKTSR